MVGGSTVDSSTRTKDFLHDLLLVLIRDWRLEGILDFGTRALVVATSTSDQVALRRRSTGFVFRFVKLSGLWNARRSLSIVVLGLYCLLLMTWLSNGCQAWPAVSSLVVQRTVDRLARRHSRCLLLHVPRQQAGLIGLARQAQPILGLLRVLSYPV